MGPDTSPNGDFSFALKFTIPVPAFSNFRQGRHDIEIDVTWQRIPVSAENYALHIEQNQEAVLRSADQDKSIYPYEFEHYPDQVRGQQFTITHTCLENWQAIVAEKIANAGNSLLLASLMDASDFLANEFSKPKIESTRKETVTDCGGGLVAFNRSANSLLFPKFSKFHFNEGHILAEVSYEPKPFTRWEMAEHALDSHARMGMTAAFPYKFEYFDISGKNFCITEEELCTWKSAVESAAADVYGLDFDGIDYQGTGSTHVNLALKSTLIKACEDLETFKQENELAALIAADMHMPLPEDWRFNLS